MGTADKLCAVALGIWNQSRRLGIDYNETSFIYAELGGAFTAVMAVEKGKVVDGLGGTSGCLGYLSMGAMDGELAYLLGSFHKELLCTGGVAYIAGNRNCCRKNSWLWPKPMPVAASHGRPDGRPCKMCSRRDVRGFMVPRNYDLRSSLPRRGDRDKVSRRLSTFAPVRKVEGFARVAKEAAQGAALIAEG